MLYLLGSVDLLHDHHAGIIYGVATPALDGRPRHQVSMGSVKILNSEDDWTARGIKGSIYIRMLHSDLNANGGRHHLPHIWNNLLEFSCDLMSQDVA